MSQTSDSILMLMRHTICSDDTSTDFDEDLIMFINSTFSKLHQLGAGPEEGFMIEGTGETWDDFSEDTKLVNLVKAYVQMNVRLVFDPPATSFGQDALKELIKEYEWRINVMVDPGEESS